MNTLARTRENAIEPLEAADIGDLVAGRLALFGVVIHGEEERLSGQASLVPRKYT